MTPPKGTQTQYTLKEKENKKMTTTNLENKALDTVYDLLVRAYGKGYTEARLNGATREEAHNGSVTINGVTFTLDTINYLKAMIENLY